MKRYVVPPSVVTSLGLREGEVDLLKILCVANGVPAGDLLVWALVHFARSHELGLDSIPGAPGAFPWIYRADGAPASYELAGAGAPVE